MKLPTSIHKALKLFLVLTLLFGVVLLLSTEEVHSTLQQYLQGDKTIHPLLFMGAYALGTILMVPGPVFVLIGGVVYGPYWGTLYSITGVMIGSAIAFLLARYVAADWLERKVGGRLKRLKLGVESEGWRFVAFVRLVPVFPAIVLNYALGLTRIGFWNHFITSTICKLPAVAAYAYVGHMGISAVSSGENILLVVLVLMGLAGFFIFVPRIIVKLRQDPAITYSDLMSQLNSKRELLVLFIVEDEKAIDKSKQLDFAQTISLAELETRIDAFSDFTEKPVATLSSEEKLSRKAAELLAGNGFSHVSVVEFDEGKVNP